MKLIEAKENPFECVVTIIEACQQRGAFQEEEMPLINDVKTVMTIFSGMLEHDEDEACDCEKHLESCDQSCEETSSNIVQLELPLKV